MILLWLNPRRLHWERCVSPWDVESCEAKITAPYLNLLHQVWEQQSSGQLASWDAVSPPLPPLPFNWDFLIMPIAFFPPHVPSSWPAAVRSPRLLSIGTRDYQGGARRGSSGDSVRSLCLLLESPVPNLSTSSRTQTETARRTAPAKALWFREDVSQAHRWHHPPSMLICWPFYIYIYLLAKNKLTF